MNTFYIKAKFLAFLEQYVRVFIASELRIDVSFAAVLVIYDYVNIQMKPVLRLVMTSQ